jgi:hypothetical protein
LENSIIENLFRFDKVIIWNKIRKF